MEVPFTLSAATSYAYDWTGRTPFNLQVDYAAPAGGQIGGTGFGADCRIIRTDAYTGTLTLASSPGSGFWIVKFWASAPKVTPT
jgi:hypothetical protein